LHARLAALRPNFGRQKQFSFQVQFGSEIADHFFRNYDGVLHVDAVSMEGGAASGLEIEDAALQNEHLGNPGTVRVSAGKYVRVNVEIPNNAPTQTFMVHTSLTPP